MAEEIDDELKETIEAFKTRARLHTDLIREDLEKWAKQSPFVDTVSDTVSLSDALLEAAIDRKLEYLDEEDIKRFFLKALANQQRKRNTKMN